MKLYLVRHGKTVLNENKLIQGRGDYPLSSLGIEEVKKIAKGFSKEQLKFDIIYSSPLSRAYDTALIFKEELGFKGDIIVKNELIEREFGLAEKEPITDAIFDKVENDDIEGLEKSDNLKKRIYNVLYEIAKNSQNKTVIVFCHAQLIKAFLLLFTDKIRYRDHIRNASITTFTFENDRFNLIAYNEYPGENGLWKK